MTSKDVVAHRAGRRHTTALAKVDQGFREQVESECFQEKANEAINSSARTEIARAAPTASNSRFFYLLENKSVARPASLIRGTTDSQSPYKSTGRRQKNKAKASSKPREHIQTDVIGNSDYSMRDRDSERCEQCMDHVHNLASTNLLSSIRSQSTFCTCGTQAVDCDPLTLFFALYPPFEYHQEASSHGEYRRLCALLQWPTRKQQELHSERDKAWENFRIAMVEAFNMTFGTDENSMEAWERMCVLVGMERIPDTLKARRNGQKAMIQTHVNLCDLLDTTRQRSKVQVFASEHDLREYTVRTGRVFPLEEAYAGGLLKFLLREITGTYHGSRRLRRDRKKGKCLTTPKQKNS